MAVLLALLGALAYGVSDFVGGLAGKRASAWSVAAAGTLGAGVVMLVVALAHPGSPSPAGLAWGAAAGFGNGIGTSFLYRGLSHGRMGVVSPVSGVLAVVVPVLVAVVTGERPGVLVWAGIVIALPAIWLVTRGDDTTLGSSTTAPTSGIGDGLLAGLGFGALFACLGQIGDGEGFLPLVVNQCVGLLVIVLVASILRAAWVPRGAAWGGSAAGIIGSFATLAFLLAAQQGLLSVSAVLTSLYPAVTVALAAVALREQVHRVQGVGMAMCAVAVVLVATG